VEVHARKNGRAVCSGFVHRDLDRIEAIGVDEIQWQRGHHYLTLVYQIEDGMKRLLWVAQDRTEESLRGFFRFLSAEARQSIRFLCSDMWQPYLKVVAEELKQAVHVLDRFHIMKKMNEAIDQVRRSEAARLKRDGYEEVLKHSRWCLLKRPENRTEKQTVMDLFHEHLPGSVMFQGVFQEASRLVLDIIQPSGGRMSLAKPLDPRMEIAAVVADDSPRNAGLGSGRLQLPIDHLAVRLGHRHQVDQFHVFVAEKAVLDVPGRLADAHDEQHFRSPNCIV
jgi:hypothetical protein